MENCCCGCDCPDDCCVTTRRRRCCRHCSSPADVSAPAAAWCKSACRESPRNSAGCTEEVNSPFYYYRRSGAQHNSATGRYWLVVTLCRKTVLGGLVVALRGDTAACLGAMAVVLLLELGGGHLVRPYLVAVISGSTITASSINHSARCRTSQPPSPCWMMMQRRLPVLRATNVSAISRAFFELLAS